MLLCAAMSVVLAARAPAQRITSSERVAVAGASVAYMAAAFVGAHLAIRDSLAEAPLGLRSHRRVRDEFLTGSGTALSPGLPMLAVHGITTAYLSGSNRAAFRAAGVLEVGGVLYTLGQLCEPITYRIAREPGAVPRSWIASVTANILLPSLLTTVAARARVH